MSHASANNSRTANAEEIARFSAMAEKWWDPNGAMKPLHKFNPIRLQLLRDNIAAHLGRDANQLDVLKDVEIIDIGCGAGLLSEPLARMGAKMTSIDAAENNIEVAKVHAAQSGPAIDYRNCTPEMLVDEGKQFDIVLNMEVIEHVDDPQFFMQACAALLKPGGLMFVATLNRTIKSLALAKFGAEYILRWLPAGTHDWRKFVKPSEMSGLLRGAGLDLVDITGVTYNPITDKWSAAPRDLDINYMVIAQKPAKA
ncbi:MULTISPECIES: bifunctional 2-polyprenyl-6-hydroxyphenol methylase/3-demethylubiquinol 3-O-methyltransferase UbiG [Thalassospira]|jgi:2-polyprenyl-6-hydroxyphenyl methylase/3-demethylubiquinone-9 3-methyltransferase|uniref:Ubiquinone biosynthesis O-methyltransferase n=1 Tax=Thalassospira xiamenensis TaxID=220697 RepID=A0ABR5Y157_9PROT|nr:MULTISPECIES: bifunctional 2-polyprenyl-6-hydroxyphenol methylase/3-demethylubiquinol 3-O-methyltransferase UbiG [Thalassospira]KZD02785.1 bifunctional 3-demethylubiquinone 3-O-methyltransferase/2-octaprenyl-6-hydroxy phenol methylase [Thalassospira xiamenensis]KZD10947.1 bifunctional 3-demethylubiquinone 3-O-methyltransferase/2-octaprenyl-6-hydroxy phenol methylase [Thalassospira xiamenensis]MAB33301.1 bifunctional 2-polyprenyl-6-hydroxyphenol methylase/3-demethylubiquinol 3-O-methyltransfer|tara:strand:+ start:738 stop:1502 length:765 start_codon:yes stop_codon:yes gene_type:complete